MSDPAGTAKPFTLNRTKVYKLYYTSCEECGAISDYADDRKEAERNRRMHVAEHRRFEEGKAELHPMMQNRA